MRDTIGFVSAYRRRLGNDAFDIERTSFWGKRRAPLDNPSELPTVITFPKWHSSLAQLDSILTLIPPPKTSQLRSSRPGPSALLLLTIFETWPSRLWARLATTARISRSNFATSNHRGWPRRRARRVLGQARSTQRRKLKRAELDERLTRQIIELACQFGRHGYRRVGDLLRWAGWGVNDKRAASRHTPGVQLRLAAACPHSRVIPSRSFPCSLLAKRRGLPPFMGFGTRS